eukprot:3223631-Pyramimonas_sp.AAC.1
MSDDIVALSQADESCVGEGRCSRACGSLWWCLACPGHCGTSPRRQATSDHGRRLAQGVMPRGSGHFTSHAQECCVFRLAFFYRDPKMGLL